MVRNSVAVVLLLLIAAAVGVTAVAYRLSAQEATASASWNERLNAAGLSRASPARVAAYLRRQHLTCIRTSGPQPKVPIPGYSVLTARLEPVFTFSSQSGFSRQPHSLSIQFCNGRLYAVGVGPWVDGATDTQAGTGPT